MFNNNINCPIAFQQKFKDTDFNKSFFVDFHYDEAWITPKSRYSCVITTMDKETNLFSKSEYVENINNDKRFNNFYITSYMEYFIFIDFIFNPQFFTVGEMYSVYDSVYKLESFDADKLIFRISDAETKEYTISSFIMEVNWYRVRENNLANTRYQVWHKLFNSIHKVSEINPIIDVDNLLPISLADESVIYEYANSYDETPKRLVYISYFYPDSRHMMIVDIRDGSEHTITYDNALNMLKPVVSLNDGIINTNNLTPLSFIDGVIFDNIDNCIIIYNDDKENKQLRLSNASNYKIYIESDDTKIFPHTVIGAYKIINNEIQQYNETDWYILFSSIYR